MLTISNELIHIAFDFTSCDDEVIRETFARSIKTLMTLTGPITVVVKRDRDKEFGLALMVLASLFRTGGRVECDKDSDRWITTLSHPIVYNNIVDFLIAINKVDRNVIQAVWTGTVEELRERTAESLRRAEGEFSQ